VVDGGRIVELGTHRELVAGGGRYATMFALWQSHAEGARPGTGPDREGGAQ